MFFRKDTKLESIEKVNRERVIKELLKVPVKKSPTGWEVVVDISVGGLLYTSFSEEQDGKLLIISSQGKSIVDVYEKKFIYRDYEDDGYDEDNLNCDGFDVLAGEKLSLMGICGGGMSNGNSQGDSIEITAHEYPIYEVVFQPNYKSFLINGGCRDCFRIFRDYELRSYGFSKKGNLLLVSTSSQVIVWKN